MIGIRRSRDRGHADHGWLDTYHTFSFADYHDEEFHQYGLLRVINQDRVRPGQGFATHSHRDMEIVSYVLEGVLQHRDSMGNGSSIRPGDVQLMSAGTGVMHSEFNGSQSEPAHFLQMWVFPRERGTVPRYEQRSFPETERRGRMRLVVSPDGEQGSLTIGQDVRMYAGLLDRGHVVELRLATDRRGWAHVARGRLRLNGRELEPGDGAAVEEEERLRFEGVEDAEVVFWELPVA